MLFKNLENEMNANFVGDNNTIENEMNINVEGMGALAPNANMGMNMNSSCRPMCEPVQERCVHRTIVHEVPQV